MKNDFEQFLREKHAKDFTGSDDLMVEDFERWVQDEPLDTIIDHGSDYGVQMYQLGFVHAYNTALKAIREHK